MKKNMLKIGDFYLNNSLFFDGIFVAFTFYLNSYFSFFNFETSTKKENLEILSDIISSSISLAGFILASLTVIASIRSNITNRNPKAAKNPLELFFSNENYNKVVHVFKDAIIELTIIFFVSYIIWISQMNIENYSIFKWIVCAVIAVLMSVFRTLLVLFTIIRLDR